MIAARSSACVATMLAIDKARHHRSGSCSSLRSFLLGKKGGDPAQEKRTDPGMVWLAQFFGCEKWLAEEIR
jgi:hypothetical protein